MSTTGPDLTVAREAVERLMDDQCAITTVVLDANRILNRTTGEMTEPTPTLQYIGRCKIKQTLQQTLVVEGGAVVILTRYEIAIPIGSYEPVPGDTVEVMASRRDPGLVGLHFRVTDPIYGTFQVQRKFQAELRTGAADRQP